MSETPHHSLPSLSHPALAALAAADLEAAAALPRMGPPSSWHGQAPFAYLLVHELKPKLVVELGTDRGTSFPAFCSAVKRCGLPARCYAIDTRNSVERAGCYDERMFDGITALVQQHFASFATLLHCSSDTAREHFADSSIDLLHICGRHSYEAMKADFDAWLPKLSDRGVVLVQDIDRHERSLGVPRFWKEVSQQHRSFEFHHGCGLGVLAPGKTIPGFISALIDMDPSVAGILRQNLADLGGRRIAGDEPAHAAEDLALQGDALRRQIAVLTQQADALRLQLEAIRTSTSWRVMGPCRVAARLLKRRTLALKLRRGRSRDFKRISRAKVFNAAFCLGRESAPEDEGGVIMEYLATSPPGQHAPGAPPRRPMPGFHPLIYATECREYGETTGEDPLAHYLRSGMPDGPWKHAVIMPHLPASPDHRGQRVLIHGHFHYPDLLEGFLRRLRSNNATADLFITTTSQTKAAEIGHIVKTANQTARTIVVPNRGRDIGPLLMHFAEFEGYDIIGHLHGKRSPQQSFAQGENWRDFLWTHLIGGDTPMMDVIAEAFAADERLGLVFPEDPNLNDWDMNRRLAEEMAERLQLRPPLPLHFEFPKGNMFWARPSALRPLVDLGWSWNDFPAEPAASDGTVLHTLERLIPFSAARAGFGFKTLHVPHSWRMTDRQ